MANVFSPFGFREFRHLDGTQPTMGFEKFNIMSSDVSAIFTGDPVRTAGITAGAAGLTGQYAGHYISSIVNASGYLPAYADGAAGPILGIFKGCEYYNATVNRQVFSPYFPGSIGISSGVNDPIAWVITDDEMLFICQGSSSVITQSSYVGQSFGFVGAATSSAIGNTTTGISGAYLASSSPLSITAAGSSQTGAFKLVDFYSNYAPPGFVGGTFVNGTDNTTAGAWLVVRINQSDIYTPYSRV